MPFHVFEFHMQFWQMCKLFANKLYSINTYFYSPVWIMMVYNNFDAQNWLFIYLQISPQIFTILQNFAINNLRDQQFCTLLCELERLVVVLFTGLALEVEVPPGMVWLMQCVLFDCILKIWYKEDFNCIDNWKAMKMKNIELSNDNDHQMKVAKNFYFRTC